MTRANEVRRDRPVECRVLVTVPRVMLQSEIAIVSVAGWSVKHLAYLPLKGFSLFSLDFLLVLRAV
jgi:hypothetical protein